MTLHGSSLSQSAAGARAPPLGVGDAALPLHMSPRASASRMARWSRRLRRSGMVVVNHAVKHTGVGIVCAVAYFDPGNWGVDLQAGSQYGYKLLFVVLLSGIFAVFLQSLASKLGVVTGLDLASHCRLLLHDRPRHTRLVRWLALYPLYVLSEVGIVATDLAELLGSAIALCMLFPTLPLWAGVLLTSADVLVILALGDPLRGRPVKMFELLIAVLVIVVLVCMCIIVSQVNVVWDQAFEGYLPSKTVFQSGALYTSVGILGATVMPHSLFLGSALATQDRVSPHPDKLADSDASSSSTSETQLGSIRRFSPRSIWRALAARFRTPSPRSTGPEPKNHAERENHPLSFVRAHLYHGIADIVISLLGFAVMINSLILILASAVFYYGPERSDGSENPASLFDAHDLIKQTVGNGAAIMFALALLCAGQSSSIIATVAGQNVSEGFIRWRTSPVLRRIYTRLLGLIPSMAVAIVVGRSGIDTLLVLSQVVLAIVLPFIVFPLVWLTSARGVMSVRSDEPRRSPEEDDKAAATTTTTTTTMDGSCEGDAGARNEGDVEGARDAMVDFSNGWIVAGVGYGIWLIVVVANVYVLVELMLGND